MNSHQKPRNRTGRCENDKCAQFKKRVDTHDTVVDGRLASKMCEACRGPLMNVIGTPMVLTGRRTKPKANPVQWRDESGRPVELRGPGNSIFMDQEFPEGSRHAKVQKAIRSGEVNLCAETIADGPMGKEVTAHVAPKDNPSDN